jgi:predicted RNase H-like nuclease (RuvC/YqgF family)
MSSNKSIQRLLSFCAVVIVGLPATGAAQSVNGVVNAERNRTKLAQESQTRIDQVVGDTRTKEEQYKRLQKQIEGLNIYNTLLSRQIEGQSIKLGEMKNSILQVDVISRQILPAMTKMIAGLKAFVAADIPFQQEERRERIANLETILGSPDVNVAEKFRKVTEAYQIENDYGRTIESYSAPIDIDGESRPVSFSRIGRVALMYQTENGEKSAVYDQKARQWIDADQYKNDIKQGLKIARKQMSPELIMLPISAPEAG